MRKYIAMAAIAALLAGCNQKEESALTDIPAMPAPAASVAEPVNDAPASASTTAAESPSVALRKQLGPKHAFNAGVNTMMARDVCKLPAGDIAKFTAYSKWLVMDDQSLRKAYLLGAQKTAELYTAMAKKKELAKLESEVCPDVKKMLAVISRGIKAAPGPVGQAPITQ